MVLFMAKKIESWWSRDEIMRQEFEYDLERCTTKEAEDELIEVYLESQLKEYFQQKKNDASKSWPHMNYNDSFIIPVPWHTACGLDWEEYYDPCIVIESDYDDGGL